jgi:hypothetical protein
MIRQTLRELAAEPEPGHLGECPACGNPVLANGHALRLAGAFFHTRCALERALAEEHVEAA